MVPGSHFRSMVAVADWPNGASAACDTACRTDARSCTVGAHVGGPGVGAGVEGVRKASGSHWARPDPLVATPWNTATMVSNTASSQASTLTFIGCGNGALPYNTPRAGRGRLVAPVALATFGAGSRGRLIGIPLDALGAHSVLLAITTQKIALRHSHRTISCPVPILATLEAPTGPRHRLTGRGCGLRCGMRRSFQGDDLH